MIFRIGTRKSDLAQIQSQRVLKTLEGAGLKGELVLLESSGDQDRSLPLYETVSAPGLFTKELQQALLENRIDLAVHSLKDLPTETPQGLRIAALSPREAPGDILVTRSGAGGLAGLPKGASVGTSSLRREAQLLCLRPDLRPLPIRGNVPTRIAAVSSGNYDATVLAAAGLLRLGREWPSVEITPLPLPPFVPAPGQGIIAVETRSEIPKALEQALHRFHAPESATAASVERGVLAALHGGCSLPLGVLCEVANRHLRVHLFLGRYREQNQTRKWETFLQHQFLSSNAAHATPTALEFLKA